MLVETNGERELVLWVGGTLAADDGLNREGKNGLGERVKGESAERPKAVPVLWVGIASGTESEDSATDFL